MDENHPMRRHFLDGADSYKKGSDLLNPWPIMSREGEAYQAGWVWSLTIDRNRDEAATEYVPR